VTFLSNVTSIKNKEVCPYELLFGCNPKLPTSLTYFVEIGVVTTKSNIQSKLKNRGTPCMSVGYTVHYENDVYRMINLDTNSIIQSCDIIWLNEVYYDWVEKFCKRRKSMMVMMIPLQIRRLRSSRMISIS
jgi:hypothetical protein